MQSYESALPRQDFARERCAIQQCFDGRTRIDVSGSPCGLPEYVVIMMTAPLPREMVSTTDWFEEVIPKQVARSLRV